MNPRVTTPSLSFQPFNFFYSHYHFQQCSSRLPFSFTTWPSPTASVFQHDLICTSTMYYNFWVRSCSISDPPFFKRPTMYSLHFFLHFSSFFQTSFLDLYNCLHSCKASIFYHNMTKLGTEESNNRTKLTLNKRKPKIHQHWDVYSDSITWILVHMFIFKW